MDEKEQHMTSQEREFDEKKKRCDELFKHLKERAEQRRAEEEIEKKYKVILSDCCKEKIVLKSIEGVLCLLCEGCKKDCGDKYDRKL